MFSNQTTTANEQKKEQDDRDIKTTMWNFYNQVKLNKPHTDMTSNFFNAIPVRQKQQFNSSTKRILQLGVSLGEYHHNQYYSSSTRSIIGYDCSQTAIDHVTQKGILGRLVNLDEIVEDGKKHLAYQALLEADLSVPAEILIIRTLEYLSPEAAVLLIISILNLAKPNTEYYFETYSEDKSPEPDIGIIFQRRLQPGYIASFFGPRTDIQFLSYTITHNEEQKEDDAHSANSNNTITERLVVKKI
ncbi:MAG: hypothetical protein KIT56_05940 [Gammaproteobacteria bacterium]|nr:hypothetical protein [Gammaproteobacteria bacterium]MCW5583410.1 hypothetical protein [Gammaproteobacteria bacterium]